MAAIVEQAPSLPVAARSRRVRRRAIFMGLWLGLFATLLFSLPSAPLLRIRCGEQVNILGISDDSSTLVGVTLRGGTEPRPVVVLPTWPIRLFDLTTGEERRLEHPDEKETHETVQEADGAVYHIAGQFRLLIGQHQVSGSGDYLAVGYRQLRENDAEGSRRLRVMNWQTGNVVFDELNEFDHALVGRSLLLAPRSGPSSPQLWDVKLGTKMKLGWVGDYRGLESVAPSPDARRLATWSTERLRVWNVADRQAQFELPGGVAAAVFSDDGEKLACLGTWTPKGLTQFVRIWRVVDVASGSVQTEEQEVIELTEGGSSPSDKTFLLRFINRGTGVLVQQKSGPTTWWVAGGGFVRGSFYDEPLVDEFGVMDYSQDQRRVLLYSFEAGVRDLPIIREVLTLFSRLFGRPQETVVSYQLWDQVDRIRIARFGLGLEEIGWLTPDGTKAIIRSGSEYHVWGIPPGRPWMTAFLWSLIVPVAAALLLRRSRRNRTQDASAPRSEP